MFTQNHNLDNKSKGSSSLFKESHELKNNRNPANQLEIQNRNRSNLFSRSENPRRNDYSLQKFNLYKNDAQNDAQNDALNKNENGHQMSNELQHATELHYAVLTNNLPEVETLLKEGQSPNVQDNQGNTPLHYALNKVGNEMVSLLLKYNASPDIKNTVGETVLHQVAKSNKIDIAQLMIPKSTDIDQGDKLGSSALHIATIVGNRDMVNLLLKNNSNPNKKNLADDGVLNLAISNKNEEIAIDLLRAGADPNILNAKKEFPLIQAVSARMNGLTNELLNRGVDPNKTHQVSQYPPLRYAIEHNSIDAMKILLDRGADPNIKMPLNNSLLIYSTEKSNIESVNLLLEKGADLKKFNDAGDNALLNSAKFGRVSVVELLLEKGSQIDIQNQKTGKTPVHVGVKQGHVELVKFLTEKGANLEIKDKNDNTPLFDVIPQIYSWYYKPKPTVAQSEIAAYLLEKGASVKPYETDNIFVAQMSDVLSVRYPERGKEFLYSRVGDEWERTDARRVDSLLNQFASKPGISEKDVDKLLLNLLHPDIDFKNEQDSTRHLSHLHSWRGYVEKPDKQKVEAEGWWMHVYPPLKAKSLILSLNQINTKNVDCMREFGESKERVMQKIKNEIGSQMSTYYTQRHHDMMSVITNSPFLEDFKQKEVSKYCKEIVKAPIGTEWAMASGFPGHAIYIGFRKVSEDNVARVVYNLGAGLNMHPAKPDGLVYPHVVSNIKMDHFINESPEARKYITGVIDAKLGKYRDPLVPVYKDVEILGGRLMLENIPGVPQKRQLVGNCVLKNNNVAIRNRMKNDRLFDYLKKDEQKFAKELSKVETKIVEIKEKEKDIDSLNYVISIYNSNKNVDLAIDNLTKFLEKRTNAPIENSRKLRDVERIAFYLQNTNEKVVDEWMSQRGAVNMIRDIADKRFCDTLGQIATKYLSNKTITKAYEQVYNRNFGSY